MRQSNKNIAIKAKNTMPKSARGYALLSTLMILIIISLVVISESGFVIAEQKGSAVESDRMMSNSYANGAMTYVSTEILPELDQAIAKDAQTDGLNSRSEGAKWNEFLEKKFKTDCSAVSVGGKSYKGLCLGRPTKSDAAGLETNGVGTLADKSRKETMPIWAVSNILSPCGKAASFKVNDSGGECSGEGDDGTASAGDKTWQNPRYIIELVSSFDSFGKNPEHVYRVTVVSWGRSENTSSSIQAFYAVTTTGSGGGGGNGNDEGPTGEWL